MTDKAQICTAIGRFFEQSTSPVLFLGAGVSAKAGLPTWKAYIEQLSEGLRSLDPLSAQQMREGVAEGDFLGAVEYFHLSKKMVEGDKLKLMAQLLSDFDAAAISPLAELPSLTYLTTNFDRCIFDALAAHGGPAARDYRFGDASFRQAQWDMHRFVARIHGAVEMPQGMVLSESQFKRLLSDHDYINLLRTCFLHRNVLFLGFSFYDPAIRFVFEELNNQFGPSSPGRHMALLPSNSTAEFLQKAHRLNIEVVNYDPANGHEALWAGIQEFTSRKTPPPTLSKKVHDPSAIETTRKFLAACYARSQSRGTSSALRVAISEGIVSALLQECAPKPVSRSDLLERLRKTLGIPSADAHFLAEESVKSLFGAGLCVKIRDDGGRESLILWSGKSTEQNGYKAEIAKLVRSCSNRAYLQEGWRTNERVDSVLEALFNKLITKRGFDLGAAFASGRAPETVAIESLVEDCGRELPTFDRERLSRVCQTMLQRPSAEEAGILRELGRVSFALELAFQTPRSTLIEQAIIPRTIYFDASVLLPAIVEGHPYSRVYHSSIERLRRAATSGASELRSCVSHVYLNEIITHRALAEGYANEIGKDFADYARMDALYHGVANVNVFVGAYANSVGSSNESFRDFLGRIAPYDTEHKLKKWLEQRGFSVIDTTKGSRYVAHYQNLERAYASKLARGKKPILIEHDALQLSILDDEHRRGMNTLFVTADRALHNAVSEGPFSHLTRMMLSHVALVQFIDLLLGGMTEEAGVADLLWSGRISDESNAAHAFFTAKGLEQYDEAMALEMPQIVERFSERASLEFGNSKQDFESDDPRRRAIAVRTLGMLERDYLESMREAAEKLRRKLDS